MEENKREVETDEVDELLDEIPKATSPHYEDVQPKSIHVDSCKGPYSDKFPKKGSPQQRNMASVDGVQSSLTKSSQANEPKLPNKQSLTSAFAKLNVDGFSGSQHSNLSMDHLNTDSQISNSGFDGISGARIMLENSEVCWSDPLGLEDQQVGGRYQQIDNSTGGISMTNNRVQFVPNLPVHPVDLAMTNQQQHFMNSQSLLPYLHSPHTDQFQTAWRNIGQENFYNLWQQRLYYKQLFNHHFEALHSVHSNVTIGSKRQQFYEIPVSEYHEQPEQDAFLHGCGLTRCLKPHNLSLSSSDARAVKAFDRISYQGSAKRSMMRSDGIRSLGPAKFGIVDEMINPINQKREVASKSQLYHSLCSPNDTKCFLEDSLNYFRSCDSRLLPLEYNNWTDEASNRTHLMAKDQHWCRFLQRKISEGGAVDLEKVFNEIIDHIVGLMTDPFGNYLVQKLIEVCNEVQRTRILELATENSEDLIRISCDIHGTRVVQKIVETLKTPEQMSILVNSLKPCIVILMKDTNGNHVALRCLRHLMPEYSQFLFDAAATYCLDLATDRHGCCVLQKCLNYSVGKQRMCIIHEITCNALVLSQDPFGNYVVQFIFELDVPQAVVEILDQLEGNYAELSMQKCSSNVVEKCLEYAAEERRGRIIQELIGDPRFDQIMQDPYGNYVIQAALNCSNGAPRSALVTAIEAQIPVLLTSPYGKKVLSCVSLKK